MLITCNFNRYNNINILTAGFMTRLILKKGRIERGLQGLFSDNQF